MTTLLEKAKQVKLNKHEIPRTDKELCELALSWAKGEVTLTQCSRAMGKTGTSAAGSVLYYFASAFRQMIKDGKLVIKR